VIFAWFDLIHRVSFSCLACLAGVRRTRMCVYVWVFLCFAGRIGRFRCLVVY
jgi:hypothetical protein